MVKFILKNIINKMHEHYLHFSLHKYEVCCEVDDKSDMQSGAHPEIPRNNFLSTSKLPQLSAIFHRNKK